MMHKRIVTTTTLHLTRQDGKKLSFGEGSPYPIYAITGLDIGEVEKETVNNALNDGELWLSSRVVNRVLEIESAWGTAADRWYFKDFFQHKMRFEVTVNFNGSLYYGSCFLDESYKTEDNNGDLYTGASIEIGLYFPDPYFYTDTVYRYQIGHSVARRTLFYTTPAQYAVAIPPGPGFIHIFSILTEAQVYEIPNPSSAENGIEAVITALGIVTNPRLTNQTTGEFLQVGDSVNPLVLQPGDTLYINTQMGSVAITHNGRDVLWMATLESDFIQVVAGKNKLLFSADSGGEKGSCEISFRGKVLAL